MQIQACMRCGSADLATPGVGDGVLPTHDFVTMRCLRCDLASPPAVFSDLASYQEFKRQREALYKPDPGVREHDPLFDEPTKRGWVTGGLAALIGAFFLFSAALLFYTALRTGGSAWWVLGPSGVFALLLGLPFLAIARKQ